MTASVGKVLIESSNHLTVPFQKKQCHGFFFSNLDSKWSVWGALAFAKTALLMLLQLGNRDTACPVQLLGSSRAGVGSAVRVLG